MMVRFASFIFSLFFLAGILSACAAEVIFQPASASLETAEQLHNQTSTLVSPEPEQPPRELKPTPISPEPEQPPLELKPTPVSPEPGRPPLEQTTALDPSPEVFQTWQDAYAWLLQESESKEFFLCDIDADEIPELLVGGPEDPNNNSHNRYYAYTYQDNQIVFIGDIYTRTDLWIDNSNGILGYAYGAGSGESHRYYMSHGMLCYDGDVIGYYYDNNGNIIDWFRGLDGSEIIVTDETEAEYRRIKNSYTVLERYDITETNIAKVIYCGN